ncbi:AsmA family protein [Arcticibacter tournemirensis]
MLRMQRWPTIAIKAIAILTGLIFLVYVSIAVYINFNKKELLTAINKELNSSLNGSLVIGSMEPSFLKGFPGISVSLRDVSLRDSLWKTHQHTLLQAKDLDVSINAIALITGTIRINRVGINNARIYLFTDSAGYSNTSVFKKNNKVKNKETESGSTTEIRRLSLNNVAFILDNRQGHKLFRLAIKSVKGKIDHTGDGWKAGVNLNILINDLAFNTRKGSFLKDKLMNGSFSLRYNNETDVIGLEKKEVSIGEGDFLIGGKFDMSTKPVEFVITLDSDELEWKDASSLLTKKISGKLNKFDLTAPIGVKAVIAGNMGPGSQPSIDVSCKVENNVLTSPGGIVDKCNFTGVFTNHAQKGKGNNDPNSLIKLYHFTGDYEKISFTMDSVHINDLTKPVATGTFRSKFPIVRLNQVFGEDLLKFNGGVADVNLVYKADMVDLELRKPIFKGTINIENADIDYQPRKLNFKNSSIGLRFTENDLLIKNIQVQSGSSIVKMEGSVKNFMNLYYTAPERILFNWEINSPRINLGEFLGFLALRKRVNSVKKRNPGFMDQLNVVLEKSNVDMRMRVDKVIYDKFTATDANANLTLSESGIKMKDISVRHAGGTLRLNGSILQKGSLNHFKINTKIANVNIRDFFYSFNNFGLQTFTHKNLKGFLFSRNTISGSVTDMGKIVPRSLNGTVIFDIRKGALIGFEPIMGVGKFAFPFRDLENITFSNLNGKFDIRGEKVTINPMMVNSSVLNMNVAGVYSLGKGTNIALDVPLRNPKKDADITDKKEIQERRMKGIVLHILATDGDDGKIKFKWNKNHK